MYRWRASKRERERRGRVRNVIVYLLQLRPHSEYRHRLNALRNEMRLRTSVLGSEVDAYILTSFDEHLNDELMASDKRMQYLTGFSGTGAVVVVIY